MAAKEISLIILLFAVVVCAQEYDVVEKNEFDRFTWFKTAELRVPGNSGLMELANLEVFYPWPKEKSRILNELVSRSEESFFVSMHKILFVTEDKEEYSKRAGKLKKQGRNIMISMQVEKNITCFAAVEKMDLSLLHLGRPAAALKKIVNEGKYGQDGSVKAGEFTALAAQGKLLHGESGFEAFNEKDKVIFDMEDTRDKLLKTCNRHLKGDYLIIHARSWGKSRKKVAAEREETGIGQVESEKVMPELELYALANTDNGDIGELKCFGYDSSESSEKMFPELKQENKDSQVIRDNESILVINIFKPELLQKVIKERKQAKAQSKKQIGKLYRESTGKRFPKKK